MVSGKYLTPLNYFINEPVLVCKFLRHLLQQKINNMETSDQLQEKIIKQVSAPLYSAKRWMKFIGILLIIGGVFYALSIVGIIFAWIPIWLGIMVTGAANKIGMAYNSGDKYSFIEAQKKIGLYFTIYGVLILIFLILTLVFLIVALSTGFLTEMISNIENSGMQYY